MRKVFRCIFVLLLAACCAAPALAVERGWGRVYTVRGSVVVHENPDPTALQVRVLKSGQKVRVDFEDAGWAAVFDPQEQVRAETRAQGYVRLSELRSGARVEPMLRAELSEKPAKSEKIGKTEKSGKSEMSGKSEKASKSDKASNSDKTGKAKDAKKAEHAQGFGEVRVADRKMAIRAGRDKDSEFRTLLPAGRRVRVDFHEDGWYAVFPVHETERDLSRAMGFGRDKFLVPEKEYAGEVLPDLPPPAARQSSAKETSARETGAKESGPKEPAGKASSKQKPAADSDAVGYAVLGRQPDHLRPLAPVVLRVRLEVAAPPTPDVLRKIAREIWKAEHRKNEDIQLEMLLPGMDKDGLAYGVARFHEDGRIREFWWREVVLRTKR